MLKRALSCSQSESLDWRNLALRYNSADFFFADHGSAEIRDFCVELVKGALGELLRWREVFLKFTYVLLRAFDLIRRQRAKNLLHRFDFRHAMAKHHYVISCLEAEANGLVQSIPGQNRAHV